MDLFDATYTDAEGWSRPLARELDGPNTLVLAFAAPERVDAAAALAELQRAFPRSVLAGCSTSGVIAGASVRDACVTVSVTRFAHTRLQQTFTAVPEPGASEAAGMALAASLAGEGLRAVFVLSDGLNVNGSLLVAGLQRGLPADVPVSGGLAGDGSQFRRTWIIEGGLQAEQRVCAIGFYGSRLKIAHGSQGGWSDFGPERLITRSEANVLYELDGKPALALYKTYLGPRAAGLPGTALLFPLAVRRAQSDAQPVVRTILGIDEDEQSLTFAGDMPQGGIARLMRSNMDRLIESAGLAAQEAGAGVMAGPVLVIAISCVGRRLVLGERTEEELETVRDAIAGGFTQVGFYSYGEISPERDSGTAALHNQTMTLTVLSEH